MNMMSFIVAVQLDPDPLLQENMALKAELRRLQVVCAKDKG